MELSIIKSVMGVEIANVAQLSAETILILLARALLELSVHDLDTADELAGLSPWKTWKEIREYAERQ